MDMARNPKVRTKSQARVTKTLNIEARIYDRANRFANESRPVQRLFSVVETALEKYLDEQEKKAGR